MNAILPSKLARTAVSVGFKNHWRFRVVGENAYKDEWVKERVTEAPRKAQDRIVALKRAGIPIKEFVVAHEAPRLLCAPKEEPKVVKQSKTQTASFPLGEILQFLVYLFILPLTMLDPALIVVLEDGTWLEVMTWYE